MGYLILMNDVCTDLEESNLLIGGSDPPANSRGQAQADQICSYFYDKIENVDLVFSSDATSIRKLVHKLRTQSKDQHLTSLKIRRTTALRERNFGVLTGCPMPLSSDLFSHTRIMAEDGESIFQCRTRIMKYVNGICQQFPEKTLLCVSHSFACQIAMNAILQKDHTFLTDFWQKKGSFIQLYFELSRYGIKWDFRCGHNTFSDTSYTQKQIYRALLGKQGALSHEGS